MCLSKENTHGEEGLLVALMIVQGVPATNKPPMKKLSLPRCVLSGCRSQVYVYVYVYLTCVLWLVFSSAALRRLKQTLNQQL